MVCRKPSTTKTLLRCDKQRIAILAPHAELTNTGGGRSNEPVEVQTDEVLGRSTKSDVLECLADRSNLFLSCPRGRSPAPIAQGHSSTRKSKSRKWWIICGPKNQSFQKVVPTSNVHIAGKLPNTNVPTFCTSLILRMAIKRNPHWAILGS
jgi:hypothetical protein